MPIASDRIHSLLVEYEELTRITRQLYETLKDILVPSEDMEMLKLRLFDAAATIETLNKLPGHAHRHERDLYNRNAKRNTWARNYQQRKRRGLGIAERSPPGSPAELEAQLLADREYKRFNRGEKEDIVASPPKVEAAT